MIEIRVDQTIAPAALGDLWLAAWGNPGGDFTQVLARSLAWLSAHDGDRLVGFVNIAWDGGIHAFLLDTSVHPDHQRQGIGTRLVREAARIARERGAKWLHVDYEPHLGAFYRRCGFRPTEAGLIDLIGSPSRSAPASSS